MNTTQEAIKKRLAKPRGQRRHKWTPERVDEFVKHFEDGGTVEEAGERFDLCYITAYTYYTNLKNLGKMFRYGSDRK